MRKYAKNMYKLTTTQYFNFFTIYVFYMINYPSYIKILSSAHHGDWGKVAQHKKLQNFQIVLNTLRTSQVEKTLTVFIVASHKNDDLL